MARYFNLFLIKLEKELLLEYNTLLSQEKAWWDQKAGMDRASLVTSILSIFTLCLRLGHARRVLRVLSMRREYGFLILRSLSV